MSRGELIRNRGLLAVLARDVVSMTGSQMTWLALPWFVLTTTGSASRMALVLAVESASLAIFGFLSGDVAARLGARRTMLAADAVRAPLVAAVPLLHALGALSFPLLLVLVAAISAVATPSFASKASILPELVGEDEKALTEANALLQAANRITMVLGPGLAGALIAVVGAANVLLIDAVTFAVGFALVASLVRVGGRVEHDEHSQGLTAGFRFLARDSLLRPWSIAIILGDAGWLVLFAAMPVLVLASFGEQPELLGWIWGGWGLGAVVGSLVTFRIVAKIDRMLVASIGELLMILPLWLLLADLPAFALVAVMWASGFVNGVINAPIWTIFTLRTPAALRAKAMSMIVVATAVLGPVALLAAGRTLDTEGFVPVVTAIVVVQTFAALAFTAAGLRHRAATCAEPALET